MPDDPNNVGQTEDDTEEQGLDYTGTAGMDIVDGTEHDDTISTLGGTDIVVRPGRRQRHHHRLRYRQRHDQPVDVR